MAFSRTLRQIRATGAPCASLSSRSLHFLNSPNSQSPLSSSSSPTFPSNKRSVHLTPLGKTHRSYAKLFASGFVMSSSFAAAFTTQKESPDASLPKTSVYSWGSGQFGQLGHGDENQQGSPTEVALLKNVGVTRIAAGSENSAAVTASGQLYTWGCGQFLALGHGDDSSSTFPKLVENPPGVKYTYASTHKHHSAAIDDQGNVYTWGRHMHALGRTGDPTVPGRVEGVLKDQKVIQVACGRDHTVAVTADGKVYAWGKGFEGQLGAGQKNQRPKEEPALVTALEDLKIKAVATGLQFTLFLTENGDLYFSGSSDYGQSGLGNSSERYTRTPAKIKAFGNKKIAQIAAGDYHAACITLDGEVYTWGLGSDGQIGNGTTKLHNTLPLHVEALKGKKLIRISCGGGHTAAVDTEGVLYIWGKGRDGQLGRGDQLESAAAFRPTPVPVPYFSERKIKVKDVALGKDFSLALVEDKETD